MFLFIKRSIKNDLGGTYNAFLFLTDVNVYPII